MGEMEWYTLTLCLLGRYTIENWQMDEGERLANVDLVREEGNRLFAQVSFDWLANLRNIGKKRKTK